MPAVSAFFANGSHLVYGDAADNLIIVGAVNGDIYVSDGVTATAVSGGTPTIFNTSILSVFSGAGNDTIYVDPSVNLAASNALGCLVGGEGNDVLTAGPDVTFLYGQEGNDFLTGQGGNDLIFGSAGDDSVLGNGGLDDIQGDDGNDVLTGNDGADSIAAGAGNDVVDGGADGDLLDGGLGNDTLHGGLDLVQDVIRAVDGKVDGYFLLSLDVLNIDVGLDILLL